MIKGFVFDLDGVITDTAKFHFLAWQSLGNQIGIDFDEKFNDSLKGISRMESLEKILAHGHRQDCYSSREKEQLAGIKNRLYLEYLKSLTPEDILPGVSSLFEKARAEGILMALASASQNGPFILEKLGLYDYFHSIVNPANLSKGKPDPEIFIKAARGMGLCPGECIGFEDAQSGMDGIKAAGMFGVGIDAEMRLQGADILLKSLVDLDFEDLLSAQS